MNRKGFTLVLVLVMTLIVTSVAGVLYTTSNIDMMITVNSNRISQAKLAAQSGLNHYMVLYSRTLDDSLVIRETDLTDKTSYEVTSFRLSQENMMVVSTGFYRKGEKILYSYPIRAVIGR